MFRRALRSLFRVRYVYADNVSQKRAQVLVIIAVIVFALSTVLLSGTLISAQYGPNLSELINPSVVILPIAAIVVYIFAQRGLLTHAAWGLTLIMLVVPLNVTADNNILTTRSIFFVTPVLVAGTLLSRRDLIIVTAADLLLLVIGYSAIPVPTTEDTFNIVLVGLFLAFCTAFLSVFNGQVNVVLSNSITNQRYFEAIARLSAEVNVPTLTEDDAISRALMRTVETMGVAYAQMFIADASGSLKRRVRTAFGQSLTTRVDEEVSLGDTNIIYQAARNRETMTANMDSPDIRRRHFLAATRASAAVPIMLGDELMGVLDVQIETASTFTQGQLQSFEMLADVIATALESHRAQRAMQTALKQAQETSQARDSRGPSPSRVAEQGRYWDTLFQPEGESAAGFDFDTTRKVFVQAKDLAPSLRETLLSGKTHTDDQPDGAVINVPITLGPQVLGAMSFKLPPGRQLSKRQTELVETIAERLALALENRRLFEQSRTQAERERKANDIARILLAATEVDAVLRIAADNFNNALGAINTEIHVQAAPQTAIEQSEETVS
jgi:GAF domain-containing protein